MKTVMEELSRDVNLNNLRKEFREALQSPAFQELINEVNLPEDKMMKYTSTLEQCALEYEHCKHCKGLIKCQNEIRGYAYLPHIYQGTVTFEYQMCRYLKEQKQKYDYLNHVYACEVPKEIRQASLQDIYTNDQNRFDVIAWIDQFITQYESNPHQKGLYLYGNFGCGKTYLIAALFNEMAKRNVRSAILFWPEFLRDLKSSFQTDFKEKMERMKHVSLLLIDDLGAENMTVWERDEIFGPIVQYRMQENLPTFFTSNLDLEALEKHFAISKDRIECVKARRIIERIKQLSEVKEMVSKNLRK